MPDPTMWHKIVTIFWFIVKWMDARFSAQARDKKKGKSQIKKGVKTKNKRLVLAGIRRLLKNGWRRK